MSKQFKRFFALMLVLAMVLSVMPSAFALGSGSGSADRPLLDNANEILDADVFAKIAAVEEKAAKPMGGQSRMTEADYISIVPAVKEAIVNSDTYVPGTLKANGNFLVWETTTGMPCCYDPRMEAELHNTVNDPSPAEIAKAEEEANRLIETYASTRGGSANSTKIGLIQPYWESSSSYSDSSFTSYSPYYKTMWQNLYAATGGSGMRYSMTNATVDNIANTISQCGLVIFDSHGTTDYSGSNGDYTSRANCSYLCLTTNSGVTSTDTAAQTGTYGTYYHCLKGSGYAYVSGTCIANHMTSTAPNSLVYMGICLGMATDGMYKGLRNKGVEVVYGYSQSVSFTGEKQYMQSILGYVKDGDSFGTALSKAKSSLGKWDPAYSSYSQSQAVSNHVAFPIAVSSEDSYPGHGNVDAVQTVNSTWKLFGGSSSSNYTVTATTNNSNYGTVSVSGYTITASPKTGYYASGYTVTSGTATVSQNGNTFTVNPSSNCTVRINFAAKTQYTVTLKANGSTYSTLSCYSGESVTLPSSATSVSGYSFAGWCANTVAETTTRPTILTGSYAPSGSVTLYAVYTKTEGSGGATVYQLIDTAPSSWAGNWVITYGTSTSSLYLLKGLSGNTKYESASAGGAVLLSNSGASYADGQLSGVTNAYVWKATADGSYYKLQNVSTGTYLSSKSSYLYSQSSYSTSYGRWTLSMSSGNVTAKNTASSSYPYLSFSSSNYFMVGSSAPTGLYFWKETSGGTTYYTTSPSTSTHTHSYGSWTSNNNGTHSRSCSCGDVQTANCTYSSVVTAPTTTSQGYTTYTCTVCGYSYVGDYTDPTPSTNYYTVTFSVPSGVTKPSNQTVEAGGTITLPTAGAPSGYTFLGWVTSTVSNATTQPTTYTGTVTVNGNVTLYALYSYTQTGSSSGGTAYELLSSAPSDWTGNYLITYGTSTSSLYALKGLSGNTNYESASSGGAVLYSNAGMSYADGYMTGVSNAYVWKIAKTGSYYTIQNASTGTYLGNYSSYLYSRSSYSSTYCRWTLSCSSGDMTVKSTRSTSYPYLSFSSNNYFIVNSSAPSGLYFWKQTTTSGGSTVTYYTTG